MKKRALTLIVLFALFIPFTVQSQTVLYTDNFDTYTLGAFLTVSAPQFSTWDGVPGGASDVTISDEKSSSAPHSIKFASLTPDGTGDIVWSLENKLSGVYEIEFKILIGDGATEGGYFNMLQVLPPSAEWAFSLIFLPDSTLGFSWNNTIPIVGTYDKNIWNDIRVKVNLDADSAQLYVNNNMLAEWQWSIKEAGGQGLVQLAGVNFYTYAGGGPGSSVRYYIDDVKFTQLVSSGVIDNALPASLEVWPNPVTDIINVNTGKGAHIEIFTLSGILAGSFIIDDGKADISNLSSGVYLARVVNGNVINHIKVVKR